VGELCGLTAGLVDFEILRCGLSGPVQAALDDKVAAVEGAAVIETVLRELTDVGCGRGSSVRSKLHPDDAELCVYGERHSECVGQILLLRDASCWQREEVPLVY
jgi:hypothetical protein